MSRLGSSFAWLATGFLLATTLCVGCEKTSTTAVQPAPPVPLNPETPEERFIVILDTFKRGIEDVPASFVATGENGHSMLTATNKVTHELIPPEREGEPYRAKIIVTSNSRFSMQRGDSEEKNRKGDKDSNKNSSDSEDPNADASGSELESEAGSTTAGARKRLDAADGEVARAMEEDQRTYDLIYKDGRWTLVTQLDKKTERSIQNAFDHALATQS